MSFTTLLYCLILTACELKVVKGSAISSIRDEGAPLLLYNPGHDLEGFDYGSKRDRDADSAERGRRMEHPGAAYIRVGRSQVEGLRAARSYPNIDEVTIPRPGRRSDDVVRFGRSSLKVPHHKIDQSSRGFYRMGKSGGSEYVRFGRSAALASGTPTEAEMAILCPNILVAEDLRGSKDLQMYLAKLVNICNNNNNNNNNNGNGDGIEDNSHRNNLEFLEVNGDAV